MASRRIINFILVALFIAGCQSASPSEIPEITPERDVPTPLLPKNSPIAITVAPQSPPVTNALAYEFPASIDPARRYMFYLHGKIIEDQGIPAVSPDYGEYEYFAILEKLASYGFVVISEQRPENADIDKFASKVVGQISRLLDGGVPPENVTVVGASKGSYIAAAVSYYLKNSKTNFVLLGSCHSSMVEDLLQKKITLYGNILAIYDSVDEYAGSCDDLFAASEGMGIARQEEIVLHIGTGHGILYKPLDEWVLPTVKWAGQ